MHDQAHGQRPIVQWNAPEPSLGNGTGRDGPRRAEGMPKLIGTPRAAPVAPDRHVLKDLVRAAILHILLRHHPCTPGGIHQKGETGLSTLAALAVDPGGTPRSASFEGKPAHFHLLVGLDPNASGMLKQEPVELGTWHLKAVGGAMTRQHGEPKGPQAPTPVKQRPFLAHKAVLLYLRERSHDLQNEGGRREQRLADMKARMRLFLQQGHIKPLTGQQSCHGRSCRSPSNHKNICCGVHHTRVSFLSCIVNDLRLFSEPG
jgi:hypothetical protein